MPAMAASLSNGAWIEPTIWTDLPESSSVVQEEIFGPCVHVAPFDTESEAMQLASHPVYGLAAMVWTRDGARIERVTRQLEAGLVWVNTWLIRDLGFPFGGMKQSGIGREGGASSIEFSTDARYVVERVH